VASLIAATAVLERGCKQVYNTEKGAICKRVRHSQCLKWKSSWMLQPKLPFSPFSLHFPSQIGGATLSSLPLSLLFPFPSLLLG